MPREKTRIEITPSIDEMVALTCQFLSDGLLETDRRFPPAR